MSPVKLLVVDDDELLGWALEREFSSRDIAIRTVGNAREALAELRNASYDLVFLDIHLPDANGIELLEEIGRISSDSKIVVMSADATDQNRQRALSGGAVQFLEKPFDLSEIHSVLRNVSSRFPHGRQHPRYVCRIPLRISIVSPSLDEAQFDLQSLNGLAADFGVGGLRIHTEYPLQVGQQIRTRAASENDLFRRFVPPESHAEVVWVAPTPDGVMAGLKFAS